MRKTKAQLKKTASLLLPTNKELGAKPTKKQRAVATKIVERATEAKLVLPIGLGKTLPQVRRAQKVSAAAAIPAETAKKFLSSAATDLTTVKALGAQEARIEVALRAAPKRDISKYEPLEEHFERQGREYQRLHSNAFASLYAVKVCGTTCFETFERTFAEAAFGEIRGVKFSTPAREVFPSDRVFGWTAWCDISIERAATRFAGATETAVQRYLGKKG